MLADLTPLNEPSSSSPTTDAFSSGSGLGRRQQFRGGSPRSSSPTTSPTVSLECPPGLTYMEFIKQWNDIHVARWLSEAKVGQHAARFRDHDIRGDVLLDLDQSTLKETGILSVGDRIKIIVAVKALRQKCARISSPAHLPSPLHLRILGESQIDTLKEPSPSRTSGRGFRPPPLNIVEPGVASRDFPQLVNTASATNATTPRVPFGQNSTPLPPQSSAQNSSPLAGRTSIPPPLPAPRSQLPLPPRIASRNASALGAPPQAYIQGRKTPEPQPPPAFTKDPLPPAPNTNTSNNSPSVSTPTWQGAGGYGLPTRPSPGNLQGGTFAPSLVPFARSGGTVGGTLRGAAARALHQKSGSMSNMTRSSSPTVNISQRPGTSGDTPGSGISHPYQQSGNGSLQVPASGLVLLSPITESANSESPSSALSASGYSVGRGPFRPNPQHPTPMSLEELKRLCVKFFLADEGHSSIVNVGDCEGGVDVVERVLRKMNKLPNHTLRADETQDGGLLVDGWAVYLDGADRQGQGVPLTEAELLSVCHADPSNPSREAGLTLRKYGTAARKSNKLENFFGERVPARTPGPSPLPTAGAPKLSLAIPVTDGAYARNPSSAVSSSSSQGTTGPSAVRTAEQKRMARASTISVMSGLGILPPDILADESPSRGQPDPSRSSPHKKLRNFFGHRPPSELITSHLPEFFPNTEKKVLARTARNSIYMNPSTIARASWLSSQGEPMPQNPAMASMRSSFEALPRRSLDSSRSSRRSTRSRPTPRPLRLSNASSVPRVSVSTEDGQSFDFASDVDDSDSDVKSPSTPHVLPPVAFSNESLSDSLMPEIGPDGTLTRAQRRNSYYTELKSKAATSDTSSMLTLDEIAAEVEGRRSTLIPDGTSVAGSSEQQTAVDTLSPTGDTTAIADEAPMSPDSEESFESPEAPDAPEAVSETGSDDEESPAETVAMKREIQWSKGALIGAGSFGSVYLGLDMSRGLLMAVKQVELPTGDSANEERKKSMLSALKQEIALLKELQHTNIVQYLDSAMDETHLNIFLEYVPGGSLVTVLRAFGAFAEALTRNWVRQILLGLEYLHGKEIIHRDIKGGNILIDNKGAAKISDFGISKRAEVTMLKNPRAHRPSLQGSVFWMAPEVVKQSAHTVKADIWSIGCLVVEMLTGEHPWAQLSQMQAIFKIGSSARPEMPPDISPEAVDFLNKTFEIDYSKRPSAAELLQHPWITAPLNDD